MFTICAQQRIAAKQKRGAIGLVASEKINFCLPELLQISGYNQDC
jgi:hypothetical protein